MKQLASILIAAIALLAAAKLSAADVGLIDIKGAIDPGAANYISRAIDISEKRGDACLIIRLDTPGGLVDSTKEIVQSFYDSKVPIVVYVAPAPAGAGSAGVFITMAADVAAMAPHTSIGAAHPVSIGMTGEVEKTDDVMKKKQENFISSFAESIADKRHRNADWAKSAVMESVAITAERALDLNVIDLIANDLPDLLKKLDGREAGDKVLKTAGATIREIPMLSREKFLKAFLRPEVMFVLMLMVIYGIIGELSSPGAILPGVAGAIALVLVLYMSAILPVSTAGLVLIGLSFIFFVIDIYAPTHGVLTFGGIASFFLGALMLFNDAGPAFKLSLPYVIGGTALTGLFFVFIVGAGLRAQRLPVRAGSETMLGKTISALDKIDTRGGKVFVEGELWSAVSDDLVESGQLVEVIGIEGLTLKVKKHGA
jgi:membrane-bound serine protease (ClpP class)